MNTLKHRLIKVIPSFLFLAIILLTVISSVSSILGSNLIFEIISHFKLQYLILSVLLFCWLLLTRSQKSLILSSIFCITLLLVEVLPWYIPHTIQTEINPNKLKILSLNINIQNQDYDKVVSFIRQEKLDIAVILENTGYWIKPLNSLKDILPYSMFDANAPGSLGIAVYSKFPLKNASIEFLGIPSNPSIFANLTINEQDISLIATHPPPPKSSGLFEGRNKQLEEIKKYVKSLSNPVVMIGDFNTTMWSYYYKKFVSDTNLRNASQGFGIIPTWPRKTTYSIYSRLPSTILWLLSIPIDQCLISPEIQVMNIEAGESVGSDHLPIIVDLLIPGKKN
jgi:endonuclease/exonuclease/phosphatase (EEP) superfamily protein YafD